MAQLKVHHEHLRPWKTDPKENGLNPVGIAAEFDE